MSALVLVYWRTTASMVETWAGSSTYTHGFVVAPIAAWLIWRDRARIARVPLQPYWPGVTVLAAAGVAWLLSELAFVNVGRQFALVVMVQATILTILGRELAARIAFPLLFLLFAVPAGDFLLPMLMERTADFTVAALRATGVPVYREGNHFVIPSGSWSVVEACGGLRYLIASLVGGTLYAHLVYATPSRRAMFIAASAVVPIVANWIRAYLIVMIGHLSSNKLAAGVDHFVYGWVFFGAVVLGLFWLGSHWRERTPPWTARPRPEGAQPRTEGRGRAVALAGAAALVAATIWQPLSHQLDARKTAHASVLAEIEGGNGWLAAPAGLADWKPRFVGHRAEREQVFEKGGRKVAVYLAYYRRQGEAGELVSTANALVASDDRRWRQASRGAAAIEWAGSKLIARSAELIGSSARLAVWHWYWIDGETTANDVLAKLLLVWTKLRGRGDGAIACVVYTDVVDDNAQDASATLAAFAREMAPAIERSLAAAAHEGSR